MRPPAEQTVIAQGDDFIVHLHPGDFTIHYQSGAADPWSPRNTIAFEYEKRHFPPSSYVCIQAVPRSDPTFLGSGWAVAVDLFAKIVGLLELGFPGIVTEKLFEGTIATPSAPFQPHFEEGFSLGGRGAYDPAEVGADLQARADRLQTLSTLDRSRFVLASRWLRRAAESKNSIDRLLFYYMVLEVFPTTEGTDVPGATARLLAEHLYPVVGASEVKARLDLGRICGFRGAIIHDGKANVASAEEWRLVNGYIERLGAVARTCLRLLAGLEAGNELDRYLLSAAL